MLIRRRRKPLSPRCLRQLLREQRHFEEFCAQGGLGALPALPQAVLDYLRLRAQGAGTAQLLVIFRAINEKQVDHGYTHVADMLPMIEPILRGSTTKMVFYPELTKDDVLKVLSMIGKETLIDLRDRALILTIIAAWLRGSEVPLLHTDYLDPLPGVGLLLEVPGPYAREIALPRVDAIPQLCAVRALNQFRSQIGESYSGPLFPTMTKGNRKNKLGEPISAKYSAFIVRQRLVDAGFDASHYGITSLRISPMLSACRAGVSREEFEARAGFRSETSYDCFVARARRLYAPPNDDDLW
jgi:hypothetical protein